MNTVLDLHIYKGRCNVPEQCLKPLLSGQDNGYVPDDRQVDAARKSRANSRGNSKYAYIAPPKTGLNASYSENPLSVPQRMRPLASYSSATSRFESCHIRFLLAI